MNAPALCWSMLICSRKESILQKLATKSRSGRQVRAHFVMQSSGGITALATSAEQPVRTVLSGQPGALWALLQWRSVADLTALSL